MIKYEQILKNLDIELKKASIQLQNNANQLKRKLKIEKIIYS